MSWKPTAYGWSPTVQINTTWRAKALPSFVLGNQRGVTPQRISEGEPFAPEVASRLGQMEAVRLLRQAEGRLGEVVCFVRPVGCKEVVMLAQEVELRARLLEIAHSGNHVDDRLRGGARNSRGDALLAPQTYLEVVHDAPLRAIVDALLSGVRMAALALEDAQGPAARTAEGFRDALISISILANAAITATVLDRDLDRDVVFGMFDLEQRTVGIRTATGWKPGLVDAPADGAGLASLLTGAATTAL